MTAVRYGEEEADNIFREDAAKLGYLESDAHEPGNGRGLWAYYHDHGMVAPEELRKEIPKREVTILTIGDNDPLLAVGQDGRSFRRRDGRHTSGGAHRV
jgi:hypothetical protein